MNTKFQTWFESGAAVDALTGSGLCFVPDVTYREEHDFVLALNELDQWARQGHQKEATEAFGNAVEALLTTGRILGALRMLRSYVVLGKKVGLRIDPNEEQLIESVGSAVNKDSGLFVRDSDAQRQLLSLVNDFPSLGKTIGLT